MSLKIHVELWIVGLLQICNVLFYFGLRNIRKSRRTVTGKDGVGPFLAPWYMHAWCITHCIQLGRGDVM